MTAAKTAYTSLIVLGYVTSGSRVLRPQLYPVRVPVGREELSFSLKVACWRSISAVAAPLSFTMSAAQVSRVFQYLPAGTATVWVMTTPWFNGRVCSTKAQWGLGSITGVLGLVCWLRASCSLYNMRCQRRDCNKGFLWAVFAALEALGVTGLFVAVALLTPPGSTCFFLDEQSMTSTIPIEVTYNILGAAALLSFAAPRLLGWLMTMAELLGIEVRREPVPSYPNMAAGGVCTLSGCDTSGTNSAMRAKPMPYPHLPGPAQLAEQKQRGLLRWLLTNDRLELYMFQLLPAGTVILYQVVTAYYSPRRAAVFTGDAVHIAVACTDSEEAWLLVFIAVVGAVAFFVTLESYERDCMDDCPQPAMLFRTRGPGYKLFALAASIATAGMFVGVALLTPPGSICFFPSQYADHSLQHIATIVLPSAAGAALVLALVRAALRSVRDTRAARGSGSEEIGLTGAGAAANGMGGVVPLEARAAVGVGGGVPREDGSGGPAISSTAATPQGRQQFMSMV